MKWHQFHPRYKHNENTHPHVDFECILNRDKYRRLCRIFDVTDAVIISEPIKDSPEYWQHQYQRLFALHDLLRNTAVLRGFDCKEAKDYQTNINYLTQRLKQHENQKQTD